MSDPATPMVDVNVPRFNQAVVALATAVAFVADLPVLVWMTFLVLALSWLGGPTFAPLSRLYSAVVRPMLQPDGATEFEPAGPPRFAQLIGALFLGVATFALALGLDAAGWGLTLVVTVLAGLAATTRICVGCIVYERVVAR